MWVFNAISWLVWWLPKWHSFPVLLKQNQPWIWQVSSCLSHILMSHGIIIFESSFWFFICYPGTVECNLSIMNLLLPSGIIICMKLLPLISIDECKCFYQVILTQCFFGLWVCHFLIGSLWVLEKSDAGKNGGDSKKNSYVWLFDQIWGSELHIYFCHHQKRKK